VIVVDLDEVGFIDSSGLHVLLRHAASSSRDGARLRLTKGSQQAQHLFTLTGAIDHLPFVDH
jgi:anti-anti-sigma factor